VRIEDLVTRELTGQVVVHDLVSGRTLSLNGTGAFLFRLLSEGASVPEVTARLVGEYDVTPDQATADVAAFVDRLAETGLLEA
jgi:hypothetical protein